jgi:hypothetical protein
MNELKLRAYDVKAKSQVLFNAYFDIDNDGVIYRTAGVPQDEDREIAVCRFVGLTDKNGKEIFEGHILDDGKGAGVVEWCAPIAAFVVRPVEKSEFEVYQLNKGNTVASTKLVESEIIGHIYESKQ